MGGLGSGDKLARGAIKVTYSSTEKKITEEKWNDIFADFDPERFKNAPNQTMRQEPAVDSGDADGEKTGDVSASAPEVGDGLVEPVSLPEDAVSEFGDIIPF